MELWLHQSIEAVILSRDYMDNKSETAKISYTDTEAALLILPSTLGISSVVFGEFVLQANPEVQVLLQHAFGEYAEMLLRYYLSDIGAMLAVGGLPGSYIGGLVLITHLFAKRSGVEGEKISGHSRLEHHLTLWLSISLCSLLAAYEIDKEEKMMQVPTALISCVEASSLNYCPGTGDYGDMLIFYSFLIVSVVYALTFLARTTLKTVRAQSTTA